MRVRVGRVAVRYGQTARGQRVVQLRGPGRSRTVVRCGGSAYGQGREGFQGASSAVCPPVRAPPAAFPYPLSGPSSSAVWASARSTPRRKAAMRPGSCRACSSSTRGAGASRNCGTRLSWLVRLGSSGRAGEGAAWSRSATAAGAGRSSRSWPAAADRPPRSAGEAGGVGRSMRSARSGRGGASPAGGPGRAFRVGPGVSPFGVGPGAWCGTPVDAWGDDWTVDAWSLPVGAVTRGAPFCGGAAGGPASTSGRWTAPGGGTGTASADGGASGSAPSSDCGRTSTACVPP